MRVATLNLRARLGGDYAARREVLAAGLHVLAPDLIAFQEVIASDEHDQVRDLLGDGYVVHHQGRREANGSGCSIASRWPLGEVRELDLLVSARMDPGELAGRTTIAEVRAPEPLLFVNHKPSYQRRFERERELQAVAVTDAIEDVAGERHVVVAGDFDAAPDTASVRFWLGRQSLEGRSVWYRDAWEHVHGDEPGHTFSPRNPLVADSHWRLDLGRRIDYVLVRCGEHGPTLDISACRLLFEEPVDGVWASDHFGVVADLVPATAQ
jgi:endonuclease/exonuclease/phosphatase family metal-dependent hydrolase